MAFSKKELPGRSRFRRLRTAAWVALLHLAAVAAAMLLFLAYRVYVHHATFAARTMFWLGDIHRNDPDLGFTMAPERRGLAVLRHGIAEPQRRIPVRTDANGFRIPLDLERSGIATGGLVSIGCSCTYGHGVPAESTFVYLAAAQLGLEAHNLGVCSYSAVTSIELLRRHVKTLRPAVVVYGFGNFHLERSERPRTDGVLFQAYLDVGSGTPRVLPPRFSNRTAFAVAPRIEELYYRPKLDGRSVHFSLSRLAAVWPLALEDLGRLRHRDYLRLRFEQHQLPREDFARWVVQELLAVSRLGGARGILLFFPAFFGEAPMPEVVDQAARAAGVDFAFVDVSPRLFAPVGDQASYSARWQVPRDGHPNAAMHLQMANAVVEVALARGWVGDVAGMGAADDGATVEEGKAPAP